MDEENRMIDYYNHYDEDQRISGNSLERIRTQDIIQRFLIDDRKMKILDVGGGTGIYAYWLAQMGHEVHMIDPVPQHIKKAISKAEHYDKQLESVSIGDALNLNFPEKKFDIVLLLGPLYHLTEKEDRLKALNEARKVLTQGGLVICGGISKYTAVFDGYFRNLIEDEDFQKIVRTGIETGQHRNPTEKLDYFTDAYFHNPDELKNEIMESGLLIEDLVAIESFGWLLESLQDILNDKKRKSLLLEMIEKLEHDQSIIGISSHFIVIAKKNG